MPQPAYTPEALRALGLTQADLAPVGADEKARMTALRPPISYLRDAVRRFKKNKLSMFALWMLAAILLLCVFAPILSPYAYDAQNYESIHEGPSLSHPMGTDKLGRDVFVRVMIGTRISLAIGLVTLAAAALLGCVYGGLSAYIGGWCDTVLMAVVDLLMAIPSVLIIILLSLSLKGPINGLLAMGGFWSGISRLGSGLISIFIILALFNWLPMARAVRGALLMNRNAEYVLAAQMMGEKPLRIIRKHLIPNSMSVILISATSIVPSAIITESFLSFIGLGVTAPMASLGSLASDAMNGMRSYPLSLIFPAALISLIVLCFNLLGNGLRDALDPKLRK